MGLSLILYIFHRRLLFPWTSLTAYKVSGPRNVWSRDASLKHISLHVVIFSNGDEDWFPFVPKWFAQHFWLCTISSCPSIFLQTLLTHPLAPSPAIQASGMSMRLSRKVEPCLCHLLPVELEVIPLTTWAYDSLNWENELCFLELC